MPVLGAVAGCWVCVVVDCELAVRVVQTGCWVLMLGAVSWLCAWWKKGAGRWLLCELACRCWVLVLAVRVAGTGCCRVAGGVVQIGCWCRMLALAVRVVETRHAVLRVKIGAAANAGRSPEKSFACFCYLGSVLK